MIPRTKMSMGPFSFNPSHGSTLHNQISIATISQLFYTAVLFFLFI